VKALPRDKSANRNGKSAGGGQHGNGRDFAKGHDPRRGRGPRKGEGGRPKQEYVERMRALAAKTIPEEILVEIDEQTRTLLLQHHPRTWLDVMALRLKVWSEVADRGFDRPAAKANPGDEREQRFFQGAPILSMEEWKKRFAEGNKP
jgi:hypothetical protein